MRPVNITTVLLTLIVALTFQLYPWSGQGVILRPDFLFVVTLYWVIRAPHLINV
ncbi:MAG: rod shape-determining protein MreD, partial [Methylophilales bacterium 28-44-11]